MECGIEPVKLLFDKSMYANGTLSGPFMPGIVPENWLLLRSSVNRLENHHMNVGSFPRIPQLFKFKFCSVNRYFCQVYLLKLCMSKERFRLSAKERNRRGRRLTSDLNFVPLLSDLKRFFDKSKVFNVSKVKKILGISPLSMLLFSFSIFKDWLPSLHSNFDGSFPLILFPGSTTVINAQDRASGNVPLSVSPETYKYSIDLRDSN